LTNLSIQSANPTSPAITLVQHPSKDVRNNDLGNFVVPCQQMPAGMPPLVAIQGWRRGSGIRQNGKNSPAFPNKRWARVHLYARLPESLVGDWLGMTGTRSSSY
jgi:hypothetical protein